LERGASGVSAGSAAGPADGVRGPAVSVLTQIEDPLYRHRHHHPSRSLSFHKNRHLASRVAGVARTDAATRSGREDRQIRKGDATGRQHEHCTLEHLWRVETHLSLWLRNGIDQKPDGLPAMDPNKCAHGHKRAAESLKQRPKRTCRTKTRQRKTVHRLTESQGARTVTGHQADAPDTLRRGQRRRPAQDRRQIDAELLRQGEGIEIQTLGAVPEVRQRHAPGIGAVPLEITSGKRPAGH